MFTNLFIDSYLRLYTYYVIARELFFKVTGQITLVYRFNGERMENLTLAYHLGLKSIKSNTGNFYIVSYDKNETNRYLFQGTLSEYETIKDIRDISKLQLPKRLHINLLKDGEPINLNLEIFDNIYKNSKFIGNPILDLDIICNILNINCTHVVTTTYKPFSRKQTDTKNVKLIDLYAV